MTDSADLPGKPGAAFGGYPAIGEVVDGKYRIDGLLGEGAMGAVARATHLVRRATVALKFMSPAMVMVPGAVQRFVNEAVAASKIESEHIVRIHDTGALPNGMPYLVMEHLEGQDLAALIARAGAEGLPVARAVHLALQILRGLQVAHGAGVVHRDMKPANCFVVTRDAEPDFLKILDFGISKVREPQAVSITHTNAALGTPLYMAPEQARSPRDADDRSDLYSTGVILYEMLTGTTPVSPDGEVNEVLFQLFMTDAPAIQSRRAELPDGLAAAVHRALTRDPKERVGSAASMAESLAPWADERSAAVLAKIRSRAAASAAPSVVRHAPAERVSLPQPFAATAPAPNALVADFGSTGDRASAVTDKPPPSVAARSTLAWPLGIGVGAAIAVAGVVVTVLVVRATRTPSPSPSSSANATVTTWVPASAAPSSPASAVSAEGAPKTATTPSAPAPPPAPRPPVRPDPRYAPPATPKDIKPFQ